MHGGVSAGGLPGLLSRSVRPQSTASFLLSSYTSLLPQVCLLPEKNRMLPTIYLPELCSNSCLAFPMNFTAVTRCRRDAALPRYSNGWQLLAALLAIFGGAVPVLAQEISFARDVLPILSDNCFTCHGPDDAQRQADLRLDTAEGARHAIDASNPDHSELLLRIMSTDPDAIMPPPANGRSLTTAQKDILQRWIQQGAAWGQHWSFEPLQKPPVPDLMFADISARNAIDHFVQQRLHQEQLTPAAEADRRTLIRRVTLDLTGLPPTPAQVLAFLQDDRPDAYEQLADRLLSTEACGERLAWDWLDAARYADSNGYQGDNDRTMWPWRDWVVRSFNDNLPFDQFTIWQLAGDLLPDATTEQKLATAFCRNHMINGEGGRIAEENRVDYVMDMSETMGTVWLGLTFNCCRCHDHKFDPLSQQNYYQFFAFFNQTPIDGGGGNPQTPPVLDVPSDAQEEQLLQITNDLKQLAEGADVAAERERLQQAEKELRKAIPRVMVMQDRSELRRTFVLDRGLYNEPTDHQVTAAFPASLPAPTDWINQPQNRLSLARWLVAEQNPLTARVIVNRFWQQVFGIGLVKTSEDFGVQGEYPIYKDLLDWLASDFRDSGWDVKRLLRTIVTSHTYRQSSEMHETDKTDDTGRRLTLAEIDPENRLLARGARYRMPSWMLRDQALAVSGLLNSRLGGPAVNTYQPVGVWEEATFGNRKYQQDSGDAVYRRSLYVFWRRIIGPTMFFDNASRQTCMVKVLRTNTPLHALLTFNDTIYVESARVMAQRMLQRSDLNSDDERLRDVFERVVCRPPTTEEATILLDGFRRSQRHFAGMPMAAEQLLQVGSTPRDATLNAADQAAWTVLCLGLLNLDETLTRE